MKALKNALIKTTRTLRRQTSFMEPSESKKAKSALRRQQSMMETRSRNYPPVQQDYNEYQQQQYYNYYYHQQQQRGQPVEDRYAFDLRHGYYREQIHQRYPEPLYGNYQRREEMYPSREQVEEESLYANRARIELERGNPGNYGTQPRGLSRRHSMNERAGRTQPLSYSTLTKRRPQYDDEDYTLSSQGPIEEPIYQSRRGSYMLNDQQQKKFLNDPSLHHIRRASFDEQKPIDDNEKLQARKEMPSPGTSASNSSSASPSKEKNLKISRRQLMEQIYQSRRDAMQSMAEPIYVSKSSSGASNSSFALRSQPIYESKKECEEYVENEVNLGIFF